MYLLDVSALYILHVHIKSQIRIRFSFFIIDDLLLHPILQSEFWMSLLSLSVTLHHSLFVLCVRISARDALLHPFITSTLMKPNVFRNAPSSQNIETFVQELVDTGDVVLLILWKGLSGLRWVIEISFFFQLSFLYDQGNSGCILGLRRIVFLFSFDDFLFCFAESSFFLLSLGGEREEVMDLC